MVADRNQVERDSSRPSYVVPKNVVVVELHRVVYESHVEDELFETRLISIKATFKTEVNVTILVHVEYE